MGNFLYFLAIFAPVLSIYGANVDTQAAFFLIIIAFALVSRSRSFLFNKHIVSLSLILIGISMYAILTTMLVSEYTDYHAALRPIRALITLVGCVSLYSITITSRRRPANLIVVGRYIFFAISIHALIMIAQLFFNDFRQFVYEYTIDHERYIGARVHFAMAGLTNGGGAQLGVYQSVGVLLSPVILKHAKDFKGKLVVIIGALICLFSVVISGGRSGFVSIAIFFPIVWFMVNHLSVNKKDFIVTAILACFILIGIMAGISSEQGVIKDDALDRSFSTIKARVVDFFSGEDHTVDILLSNHFIAPETAQALIFGDTKNVGLDQGDENRLIKSDIGYVRILFGYGLIGSSLHYLFYFYVIWLSFRAWKRTPSVYKDLSRFSIVFAVVILVFNFKEVFVFTRMGFSITCIMVAAIIASLRSDRALYGLVAQVAGNRNDHVK